MESWPTHHWSPLVSNVPVAGALNDGSDAGFSGGEVAGIVIGAVVAVALGLLAFWFIRRRRRSTANAAATVPANGSYEEYAPVQEK